MMPAVTQSFVWFRRNDVESGQHSRLVTRRNRCPSSWPDRLRGRSLRTLRSRSSRRRPGHAGMRDRSLVVRHRELSAVRYDHLRSVRRLRAFLHANVRVGLRLPGRSLCAIHRGSLHEILRRRKHPLSTFRGMSLIEPARKRAGFLLFRRLRITHRPRTVSRCQELDGVSTRRVLCPGYYDGSIVI